MKFIVALQNKMDALKAQALGCLKKKEGQNTIEKEYMPELFGQIKGKITGKMGEM